MKESQVQAEIRLAINADGRARVTRNNTGTCPSTHVTYGLGLGGADLVGCLVGSARLFCLEVKRPGGPGARVNQERWLGAVRSLGGFAAVARSVPDAMAALERALQGASQ